MSTLPNIQDLLDAARSSEEAKDAMQATLDDLTPDVEAMLGRIQANERGVARLLVLTLLVDNSSSIARFGLTQLVRDAHNMILQAMRDSQQAAAVLVSCCFMNSDSPSTRQGVLYPYVDLQYAPDLDERNYRPVGGTPLYDRTATILTGATLLVEDLEKRGRKPQTRAVTVIISDGKDEHSKVHKAESIEALVCDQLDQEHHTILGMGIGPANSPKQFREIFRAMGIPDPWILTPGDGHSAIRHASGVLSLQVSQSGFNGSRETRRQTLISPRPGG